jgi:hypothetical protein
MAKYQRGQGMQDEADEADEAEETEQALMRASPGRTISLSRQWFRSGTRLRKECRPHIVDPHKDSMG